MIGTNINELKELLEIAVDMKSEDLEKLITTLKKVRKPSVGDIVIGEGRKILVTRVFISGVSGIDSEGGIWCFNTDEIELTDGHIDIDDILGAIE